MILNILKYIIFVIMFAITIYFYINKRNIGCRDKTALNYNSEVNIHDPIKCIFKVKGCMEKDAPNYNLNANTSCKEDCTGCDLKGNCELCEYQEECTNSCPECICKKKIYGCTRDWAINYDKNATIESNCISLNDILKNISVVSGGDCEQCSGRVSVRIGDSYPIIGGNYGINVIVLERHKDLPIKFNKSFSTGNYEIENKKFIEFMSRYVYNNDIVIITVRGDATGRKKTDTYVSAGDNTAFIGEQLEENIYTNLQLAEKACSGREEECIGINQTENSEYILMSYKSKLGYKEGFKALTRGKLFLDRILTDESKSILSRLGAKNPEIIREGSYILIGSFLNDIYYETYSANADSYFPYFDLQSYGCININHPHFEKIRLSPSKNKLLTNIGDTEELDISRVDSIYRCAQEALREGYKLFSVSKTDCYVYKIKDEFKDKSDIKNFFKYKKFINYKSNLNQNFRIGSGECKMNYNLLPYGNNYDESVFYINDVSYSGLFSMFYENMMVQTYSARKFNGIRRDVGIGRHQAISIISLSPRAIDGKLYIQLTSLKIPPNLKVSLFRNIYENEDMKEFKKFNLKIEKDKNEYFKLNLSNEEGVKISCMNEKGLILRSISYRTWENIIKNLKIKSEEVYVKVYLYNFPIKANESELDQPCIRYGVIVPGWYQDNRFGQINQCAAPKGKKCCNTIYSQGGKKGQKVRLDGVITLNGTIFFINSINIFYPESLNDRIWLEFKSNYPKTGQIQVSSNDDVSTVDYEFNENFLIIKNSDSNYSGMKLTTLGREACNVDFDNFRSSREVKEWMSNCSDNLDEITSVKWKNYGMNNAFSGEKLENIPEYYTLFNAQIACLQNKDICGGINKNLQNNFVLMNNNSKIISLKGYNGFGKVQNLINSPEVREGFDLEDIFEIKYYKEILRLKETSYKNRVGYLEFYDKNNNKIRDIDFGVWPYFWNNISYSGNETQFKVSIVDKEAVILNSSITLDGPSETEVDNNILFKEYPNISKDQNFTTDINFMIVGKSDFGVTFYEEPSFGGLSFTLSYGSYNLPDSLSFIIKSIKVKISFCIVRLFMEYNFEEELVRFEHKVDANELSYDNLNNLIEENVRIKSIIIERSSFDNFLSNNVDFDTYDENKEYEKLSYPVAIKFKNQPINYLDLVYDIFKDGLKLYDNDKKVFLVSETYLAGYVTGINIKKGIFINSGGGYSHISSLIRKSNRNDILDLMNKQYGCIETFNRSNMQRKLIFFGGKLLELKYENGIGIFNIKSLSDLTFSKKERYIVIKTTENLNTKNKINEIFNLDITLKNKLSQIYSLLIEVIFEKSLISINLSTVYEDLIQIPFINENNRSILNTNFIIQIEDDNGYITKYIKFYGQKYVIDYNIDTNIKLTSDINISKKEKIVLVNHRTNYSNNDIFQVNYDIKFNYRLDFLTIISKTISLKINKLINDIKNSNGYLETRNRSDKTINKYEFKKGKVLKLNKFIPQNEILFRPEEFTISYFNKFNKLKMILPVKDKLSIESINEILKYYLNNENCYIKLFNRYSELVKVILCKEGKFLTKDENEKEIMVSNFKESPKIIKEKFNYLFKAGDWMNAQRNIDIDLDQSQISIQLDNGTDIFMVEVESGEIVLNIDELSSLFSRTKGINLKPNIKNTKYSKLTFKDSNNIVTKQINFTSDIMLYNMPVKYLELNMQDMTYQLMKNNVEIVRITLPKGMDGVYKYGSENNKVLVHRVEMISSDEITLYDENDNILEVTKDNSIHQYIFNVNIEGYNREYKIEYFPKINQWRIKLYQQDENINNIKMYNNKTKTNKNINDLFGNIIKTVEGNSCYIIENNYTNIKLINKDNTYKYIFSMGNF